MPSLPGTLPALIPTGGGYVAPPVPTYTPGPGMPVPLPVTMPTAGAVATPPIPPVTWTPQWPAWQILVAFGFGALDLTPLWTDVTQFVRNFNSKEGRQHELDRMEPGELQAMLDDRFGEFTPGNTLSPFYNLLSAQDALGLPVAAMGTWTATLGAIASSPTYHLWGSLGAVINNLGSGVSISTATGALGYPVQPNTPYSFSMWVQAVTTAEPLTMGITWYDSTGTVISSATRSFSDMPGTWSQEILFATSPSNAAYAAMTLHNPSTTSLAHAFTCCLFNTNYDGLTVAWNKGQAPPLGITTPIWVRGNWMNMLKNVFYGFSDSWTPELKDNMNQDTTVVARDVLGLLAISELSNSVLYPNALDAYTPLGYWRMGDPIGASEAQPYTGVEFPLQAPSGYIPPFFGSQDTTGAGLNALLSSTFTGGGSGAIIYDSTTAANFPGPPVGPFASLSYLPQLSGSGHNWTMIFLANFGTQPGALLLQGFGSGGATLFQSLTNPGTGQLEFTNGIITAGGAQGPNLCDNKWHMIALVGDAHGITAYIDGTTLAYAWLASGYTNPQGSGSNPQGAFQLCGGSLFTGGNTTSTTIQELVIYSTNLSTVQIQNIYNTYHLLQDQEYTGQRIAKVLYIAGYGSYPQSLDTGTILVAAETTSQTSTTAMDYIQSCSDTELGYLEQTMDGVFHFHDHRYIVTNATSAVSQGTIGDNPTADMFYVPQGLKTPQDALDVFTDIQVQAAASAHAGAMQEVVVYNSIGPPGGVGRRTLSRSNLLFAFDTDAYAQAVTLALRYGQTLSRRVDGVTLSSAAISFDGTTPGVNIAQMLSRHLWHQVTFARQGNRESLFEQNMLIEHLEHKWDADTQEYTVTWILSPYELLDVSIDIPIGGMLPFAGAALPVNFHLCDGTAISRTTYSTLFALIGTTYGAGDGTTTFNLPNSLDRFMQGSNTNPLGARGGSRVITSSQLPTHLHAVSIGSGPESGHDHALPRDGTTPTQFLVDDPASTISPPIATSGAGTNINYTVSSYTASSLVDTNGAAVTGHSHSVSGNTQNTGSSAAYDQPYLAVNYIIRLI